MKKTKLFVMLAAMLLSFASCTERELVDNPGNTGDYTVRFSVNNPSEVQSRAYTTESKINQLYAVVFDGADAEDLAGTEPLVGVYFVDVTDGQGGYDCSFRMDQGGKFVVCFVANPYDGLLSRIQGVADVKAFKALEVTQAPERFLMVSENFYLLDLSTENTVDLTDEGTSQVNMVRNVARIDIQNSIEGLVISSITFSNRAVKSLLWNDNGSFVANDEASMSDYTYTIDDAHALNTQTEITAGTAKYEAEIYTYEQYITSGKVPSLTFAYTLNGNTYNKELKLDFVKDGAQVPLKRNTKYTVNIKMGQNKINFEITVLNWEDEETTFTVSADALADKETAIRPDQDQLNEALRVYTLFVEDEAARYNVASIAADGTVTFASSLDNNVDMPQTNTDASVDGYYTWDAVMALTDLEDAEGNSYRLPTGGELNLLLPNWIALDNVTKYPFWNGENTTYSMYEGEYTETVYLRNKQDGYMETGENYDFRGESRMKKGTDGQMTTVINNSTAYLVGPVYAYRFKGTDQFAAYRWESCKMEGSDDETQRYLSIKIKALSNYHDADITVDEIANEAFWADGYIEVQFPSSGYYNTSGTLLSRGIVGYCWSSSRYLASGGRVLHFNLSCAGVGSNDAGLKFPLRLVLQKE